MASTTFWCCAFLFLMAVGVADVRTHGTELIDVIATSNKVKRDLLDLKSMVERATSRKATDFIGYGNWCGIGGQGKPVDPLDRCCQIHDLCYSKLLARKVCKDGERSILLSTHYKWHPDPEYGRKAICDDNEDSCEDNACRCDAGLANCLHRHRHLYDEKHRTQNAPSQLFEEVLNFGKL